jgi:hypothetical protein
MNKLLVGEGGREKGRWGVKGWKKKERKDVKK